VQAERKRKQAEKCNERGSGEKRELHAESSRKLCSERETNRKGMVKVESMPVCAVMQTRRT